MSAKAKMDYGMRQYLSFDIEIYNEMLEGDNDLTKIIPSVGAFVQTTKTFPIMKETLTCQKKPLRS